jgi:hypothetical protein
LCFALAGVPGAVRALEPEEGPSTPLQLGVVEDLGLPPARRVTGLRVNLVSGRVEELAGADLLGLASRTRGDEVGVQTSFYGEVGGHLRGVQLALARSEADDRADGLQLSLAGNHAGELNGAQIALFVNGAHRARGLQLGLVNWADDLDGVQIGLVNVQRHGWIPVVPFLNLGW